MSSIPAFNGSLSYVFLEAKLRGHTGLTPSFPQEIWDATLKESNAKPLFTTTVDVVKSSEVALRLGAGLEVHLPKSEEYTFPANTAAFNTAAEAQAFHDALNTMLEKAKAHHALREGARLNDGGTIRSVGFQI